MYSVEISALVVFTFFLAGLIKGTVGLGLPIVVLVFLAVPLGMTSALSLMLVPGMVTNLYQAIAGPSLKVLLRRLWSFLLCCVVGIWIGVSLLSKVTPDTAMLFLGSVLALYSFISLLSPQIPPPGQREALLSPLAGGLGGVVFGVTGIFIVPGVLYLQALGLKKNDLVQALGIAFMTLNITLLSAFVQKGIFTSDLGLMSCAAVIPTVIGLYLGQKFRHRVSEQLFRKMFFWVLLFVGLYFIARALDFVTF